MVSRSRLAAVQEPWRLTALFATPKPWQNFRRTLWCHRFNPGNHSFQSLKSPSPLPHNRASPPQRQPPSFSVGGLCVDAPPPAFCDAPTSPHYCPSPTTCPSQDLRCAQLAHQRLLMAPRGASMPQSSTTMSCRLVAVLAFFALFPIALCASPTDQAIVLDPTCPFGNNYINFVGFTCLADAEMARNPAYNGVAWRIQGQYNALAFQVMHAKFNHFGITVGNTTYCSNFTIVNGGCDGNTTAGSYARSITAEWASKGDFFFSSFSSTLAPANMMEINAANKIIIATKCAAQVAYKCRADYMQQLQQPECTKPGGRRFKWAFSLEVPGEYQFNPALTLYKLNGAQRLVLWNEVAPYPQTITESLIAQAAYIGIDLIANLTVPLSPTTAQVEALARQVRDLKPDGVIGSGYAQTCPKWYAALRKLNYVPPAMAEQDCVTEPTSPTNVPDAIYGIDKAEFDHRMAGPQWADDFWYPSTSNDGALASPELAYQDIKQMFGLEDVHWSIPLIASGGMVLQKAIQRAGSLDQQLVWNQLNVFNEPTFSGPVGFSTLGQNNAKDVIILQADQQFQLQIVYPLGSATANFVYPAPTFDERVFKPNYMGTASELVLAGICAFFIIISIVLIGIVLIFREEKPIIAASPLFLTTILIGSILLYGSFYTWVIQAATATCYLRFWLLGLGFVMMFGALFAKTWRIMRIFTQSNIRVFRITNLQLFGVLAALLGVEAVLLAIWSGTSQPHRITKVVDPLRPSKNLLICSSGKSSKAMLGILVAYKLAIVLFGIYMSIRIWKIPLKQFNESRSIAFSMYNMLCFGVLAFGLQVSNAITDPAMFIVRSICLILSTFFTIAAIFGPKVIQLYTGHTGYSSKTSNTNTTSSLDSKRNFSKGESIRSEHGAAEHSAARGETEDINYKKKYLRMKKKYLKLKELHHPKNEDPV